MTWVVGGIAFTALMLTAYSVEGPGAFISRIVQEDCTTRPQAHEPIQLRSGRVIRAGAGQIILQVEAEPGEPFDALSVVVPDGTPVIEVRVPSYMNDDLRERLENGGNVIEREEVPFENIREGMEADVISESDTYCLSDITASRIEYEVIIDTEEQE